MNLLPIAFGFGNLAMLGWLAAAAAPIVIHLWMRHTHRDMPWAAIEFLREAIKRNARRLKLQQWILLAVRTLLLVLLVLAAAKPYLSGWAILGGGPKVHRVLVIDASFSMAYREGEETLFDRSKRLAEELLDAARPGEVFSVCLMADPPRAVVTGPVADSRRVARQVTACRPTSGAANLGDTLELVEELIAEANVQDRDYARHEVLFFTDLGKSSWLAAVEEPGPSEEESASPLLAALAEQASILVVDVGARDAGNLAMSNLHLANTLATAAAPLRVECKVANHADQAASNVVVQLVADGTPLDEQTLSLPARSSATLTFDAAFGDAAWHALSVRLAGDALGVDDEAWLAADVRQRVRILLVEGAPQAARYLVHALNPS
ncbi:MAG: BatA domain-containing protein, partial [Aeoliella sp.]